MPAKQTKLEFLKNKTQLYNDCRKGTVVFRLVAHTDDELLAPYEGEHFRKVTKVKTNELYFGRSILTLPKQKNRLKYTDENLILYDEEGNIDVAYEVRKARY